MSNDVKLEPEAIWLSPRSDAEARHCEGRSWANHASEPACDDCGLPWVKYVRADLASHQPQREAVGGKMLNVARRNLRTFLGLASFKSENDREAALNCLETIEAELSGLNDLVAVLRSALAAEIGRASCRDRV